jgi:hypothetical protein
MPHQRGHSTHDRQDRIQRRSRESLPPPKTCGIRCASGWTEDLRRLFTPHPVLDEIDCYNSLLLPALHPERHAAQIEEFPKV